MDALSLLPRKRRQLEHYQVSTHLHMIGAILAQDTLEGTLDSTIRELHVKRFTAVLTEYKLARNLEDFKAICDESNNTPAYIGSKNYCKVDIWIQWDKSPANTEHFEFPPEGFR